MSGPQREPTLTAVQAGIEAVTAVAETARPDAATPCSGWRVLDLVRHLEAIAGAYLLWTGSAVGGRVAKLRRAEELSRYNALMLARLPELDLAAHGDRFRLLATDHVRLARVTWSIPMLETPDGVVLDVGRHAGVVAIEWHVHTWDLARAGGRDYAPPPTALEVLTAAWDATLADVTGVERDPAVDAWTSLLIATGRTP